ncbi:MAG: DUF4325 domain-containing protein [candidate division KSB1 bacterium]|nr:DUF4325 domain-containing protein [candidate division KSB1 bacterium]
MGKIAGHQKDIISITAEKFGVTRQTVRGHLQKLADENRIVIKGTSRAKTYEVKPLADIARQMPLTRDLQEDVLWRQHIRPHLQGVAANIIEICQYGFTEMTNNAIEHSAGRKLSIALKYTSALIEMRVADNGIGIFQKIQTALHLDDPIHTILELVKGKLTTDPEHHTGEGIFFTSRLFDDFAIMSGNLVFAHRNNKDWRLEDAETPIKGTMVILKINPMTKRTAKAVFDRYASEEDYGFSRTHIPVSLARYGDENLVSRSQARRLLVRFERFKEIILDFKGITMVGQAFADEIFRVFAREHPHLHLTPVHANADIMKMISRAKNAGN